MNFKDEFHGVKKGELCNIVGFDGETLGPYIFLGVTPPHTEHNYSNLYVISYYTSEGKIGVANTTDYFIMKAHE